MKKSFFIVTLFLFLIMLFASCNGSSPTEEAKEDIMITDGNSSKYVIIYPEASNIDQYLAKNIAHLIKNTSGVSIPCLADASTEVGPYEILVGNTNREESTLALEQMSYRDLIIRAINEKIAICIAKSQYTDFAALRFSELIGTNGTISLSSELSVIEFKEQFEQVAVNFEDNHRVSFNLKLTNQRSVASVRVGTYAEGNRDAFWGIELEISNDQVSLLDKRESKVKTLISDRGLKLDCEYTVACEFEDQHIRVYIIEPDTETEAWPAFEVKLGDVSGQLQIGETSGYRAQIENTLLEKLDGSKPSYRNNIVENAADPDILYHEGVYYMYVTGAGYPVYKSTDLANWEQVGFSLPEVSWNVDKQNMWAPDVEYVNGKFYMAVTLGEAGFGMAVSDSPEGPFVCAGDEPFLTNTIDGHIFVDDDGRIYLYYTSWCDGRAYGIWGVEMQSDCLTPKWETEKLIFTPTEPWESTKDMGGVVEAPFMLKKDGTYFLLYSGSHYLANYAVGYATSTNPLEGFVKNANSPIMVGNGLVSGTGHCSIVTSPSGKMAMVYHVHHSPEWAFFRHVAIDPIRFVKTDSGYILEAHCPTTSNRPIELLK